MRGQAATPATRLCLPCVPPAPLRRPFSEMRGLVHGRAFSTKHSLNARTHKTLPLKAGRVRCEVFPTAVLGTRHSYAAVRVQVQGRPPLGGIASRHSGGAAGGAVRAGPGRLPLQPHLAGVTAVHGDVPGQRLTGSGGQRPRRGHGAVARVSCVLVPGAPCVPGRHDAGICGPLGPCHSPPGAAGHGPGLGGQAAASCLMSRALPRRASAGLGTVIYSGGGRRPRVAAALAGAEWWPGTRVLDRGTGA